MANYLNITGVYDEIGDLNIAGSSYQIINNFSNLSSYTSNNISNVNSNITNLSSYTSNNISNINLNITNLSLYTSNNISNVNSNISTVRADLSNLSIINNTITPVYSSERRYPPKLYNTVSGEITTTFLNKTVYTQTLTLNNDNITYGGGNYLIYYSSTYTTSLSKYLLFNYNTNENTTSTHWGLNQYNSSGLYIGTNFIKSDYLGDWIIIKFPDSIILSKFIFNIRTGNIQRCAGEWKCYGSTDGVIFTEIEEGSQTTRLITTDYSTGFYQKTLSSSFKTPYLYIGFTINKLCGTGQTVLNFSEIQIFGKDLLNPIINYISSNALNNYLIPYSNSIIDLTDDLNSNITSLNQFKTETSNNFTNTSNNLNILTQNTTNNFISVNSNITQLETDIGLLDISTSNNFELVNDYVDAKYNESIAYTDAEIEQLKIEGYIQSAATEFITWITSDEGKRFRKKIWNRISNTWSGFTGNRPYTELLGDIQNATTDELDNLIEVYRYTNNGFNTANAGIRTDAIAGKNIILNGSTLIYNGDLFLTGNIIKGNYNAETFTTQDTINEYFVMKGTKLNSCLEIETDKKLRLNYDINDFELGIFPTFNLKLKNDYKIAGISSPFSKDANNILHFDYDTDYFQIVNNYFTPKLKANGMIAPLEINSTTKEISLNYDTEYFDVKLNKLTSKALIKGVLANNVIDLDANNKLYFKYDANEFQIKPVSNELQLQLSGNSLSKSSTGLKVNVADTSLDITLAGLQISTTYKTELQQIKTDTETFKTQAQTFKTQAEAAKTQAEAAKTQAELSKTTAIAQAEIATSQAGISTTQAGISTTQAGISTTQAGISTTQAGIAIASAGISTTQAGISTTQAGIASAAAAAAAISATFFQKGDKGDQGIQGIPGDPRIAENPFLIENNTIKLKNDNTLSISTIDGNLGVVSSNLSNVNYNLLSNLPSLNFLPLTGGILSSNLNIIGSLNSTSLSQNGVLIDFSSYATNTNLSSNYYTKPTVDILLNDNYVSNDSNTSNLLFNKNYTIEREYPPKAFNTSTNDTTTTEILNKTTYKQTITLNTDGITYGSGEYTIYSSSFLISYENEKKNLFDYVLSGTGVHWNGNQYSPSGVYNQSNFIVSNYLGDWVILKCPTSIILTKYNIVARINLLIRAPAEFKCYGSTDGITFTEIIEASQMTRLISTNYIDGVFTKSFSNTISYKYIGFTFNKIIGTSSVDLLNFTEIRLFGKEFINYTPIYTPIESLTSLSNTLKGFIDGNLTTSSNFTSNTSNTLKGFIDGNLTTSSNFTSNTSNTLKGFIDGNLTTSSNFTSNTSNTLKGFINTKQDVLSFTAPLTKTGNIVSIDLSSYSTSANLSSYDLISDRQTAITSLSNTLNTNINTKQDVLSFTTPLTKTGNIVSIDLSSYSTSANLSSYDLIIDRQSAITNLSNILKGIIDGNLTTSSNFTSNTSNSLKSFIDGNLTTSSNFTSNTSNTLKGFIDSNLTTSSNFTSNTSNTLKGFIDGNLTTSSNFTSNTSNTLKGFIDGNLTTSSNFTSNTSNTLKRFIDTNLNIANNTITPFYSSERIYPEKVFDSSTTEITTTFLDKIVYTETITLNTGTYGNGDYILYSSSTYSATSTKKNLFNKINVENPTSLYPTWSLNQYNSSGNYIGTNFIKSDYLGDFLIIKLPNPIILTKFSIIARPTLINRCPSLYRFYGSNDGITFTQIIEASNDTTALTISDYPSNIYQKTLNSSFNTLYLYYGITVKKLAGNDVIMNFAEFQLFGKELLNPIVNYVSINNLIPYTTSNAVKSIIRTDMADINKKSAFYCFTNNIIYPNAGAMAYYSYNIDLRNYTKTGYIQIGSGSGDTYRIFKIRGFFASSYFQKLTNGIPDIFEYTIYMSNKTAAAGNGTIAGVNIMANGIPQNYYLNNLMNNNLFLLRNANNNFDYLTVVSTAIADCRIFIECLLS